MSGFDGNMEQLEAVADWETLTQWEGAHPPREPRQPERSRCWVSAMRDGRYRVRWTSSSGTHGVDGPFASFDVACGWCERYERDLGWRWDR